MGFRCVLKNLLHYQVAVNPQKRHNQFMFACRSHCKGGFPRFSFKTMVFYPMGKKPQPYVEKANTVNKSMERLLRKYVKGDTLLDLVLSSAWDTVQNTTFNDLLLNTDCNAHHLYRNNKKTTQLHSAVERGITQIRKLD